MVARLDPTARDAKQAMAADQASDGGMVLLYDPTCIAAPCASLLQPAAYGTAAQAEQARGGRGAIWFVRGAFGEAVLRHYRRGGLMARLSRDHYLYQGAEGTRPFREFRLLQALHALGLPVPRPLLAGFRRSGLVYRADILIQRIAGARTLAELLAAGTSVPWARIGAVLARFHAAGAYHADLNAHNVLVAGPAQEVWLIDFDRGELRPAGSWTAANLARLQRSLRKLAPHQAEQGFAILQQAYRVEGAMR